MKNNKIGWSNIWLPNSAEERKRKSAHRTSESENENENENGLTQWTKSICAHIYAHTIHIFICMWYGRLQHQRVLDVEKQSKHTRTHQIHTLNSQSHEETLNSVFYLIIMATTTTEPINKLCCGSPSALPTSIFASMFYPCTHIHIDTHKHSVHATQSLQYIDIGS